MSSKTAAVSVRNLSKSYTIAHNATKHTTAAEALVHRLKNPLSRPETETFWALKDVSFDIEPGDVVGIIGRNGAGKSTLLKVLSRITEPTGGEAVLRGRVGSLLEVGTGFHPELTGRENVYLNGAILGMSRREIDRQFDAIVDFSGTEKFLDTPVKRYSSGMYVRLAFAVAAHLEPEILIVDEVLAVGDAEFQKKCMGKMRDVASHGRTILFVSHNMGIMRALCNRGMLLRNGEVLANTGIEDAIDTYLFDDGFSEDGFTRWDVANAPCSEFMSLRSAYIVNQSGDRCTSIDLRNDFFVVIEYTLLKPHPGLRIGLALQNHEGVLMCGSNHLISADDHITAGEFKTVCHFPGHILNSGKYQISFGADLINGSLHIATPFCLSFHVEDVHGYGVARERLPGIIRPDLSWQVDAAPH